METLADVTDEQIVAKFDQESLTTYTLTMWYKAVWRYGGQVELADRMHKAFQHLGYGPKTTTCERIVSPDGMDLHYKFTVELFPFDRKSA